MSILNKNICVWINIYACRLRNIYDRLYFYDIYIFWIKGELTLRQRLQFTSHGFYRLKSWILYAPLTSFTIVIITQSHTSRQHLKLSFFSQSAILKTGKPFSCNQNWSGLDMSSEREMTKFQGSSFIDHIIMKTNDQKPYLRYRDKLKNNLYLMIHLS